MNYRDSRLVEFVHKRQRKAGHVNSCERSVESKIEALDKVIIMVVDSSEEPAAGAFGQGCGESLRAGLGYWREIVSPFATSRAFFSEYDYVHIVPGILVTSPQYRWFFSEQESAACRRILHNFAFE